MRNDMKKVVTGRARRGSSMGYGEVRVHEGRGELETLPGMQGMRVPYVRHHGDCCKDAAYYDGPVRRFLRSRKGAVWNDVFSEICATCDGFSPSGRNLLDLVDDIVEKDVRLIDGELVVNGRFGIHVVRGLYVDPVDGTLQEATRRKQPRVKRVVLDGVRYEEADGLLDPGDGRPVRKVFQHGFDEAACFAGIWHWVVFDTAGATTTCKEYPGAKTTAWKTDIVTGRQVASGRYRAGKRQMSGRDLRRLGLENLDAA